MFYQIIYKSLWKIPLALLLVFGGLGMLRAQPVAVQGSVGKSQKPADSTKVYIYARPSATLDTALFENINVCVSIPYPGPSVPLPKVFVVADSIYIPSLTWTPDTAIAEVIGDRAYYTFIGNDNENTTRVTWMADFSNRVVLLSFKEGTGRELVQLNDLTDAGGIGSGGGSSGQSFWYVQANTLGDITDYAQKYYQSTDNSGVPVNGGIAAPSAVETIKLVALPVLPSPEAGTWQLFPNPTSGMVQLLPGLSGEARLRLYTNQGHLVWEQKANLIEAELTAIHPGPLATGTYFFEVRASNGRPLFSTWLVVSYD